MTALEGYSLPKDSLDENEEQKLRARVGSKYAGLRPEEESIGKRELQFDPSTGTFVPSEQSADPETETNPAD